MRRAFLATAAVLLFSTPALAQKVGDVVFAIKECDAKQHDEVVDHLDRGSEGVVQEVKDNLLRLDGNLGWVEKENVLPLDDAEKHFAKDLTDDPTDKEALTAQASIHSWKEQFDKAIADYDQLIKADPSETTNYLGRADALWKKGDPQKAITDFEKVIELDPDSASALIGRGQARTVLKQYDKASEDFEAAVKLEPTNPVAHNGRGWFLATCPEDKFRDGQRAVDDAEASLNLSGLQNYGTLDTLAAAKAEAGKFDEAVKLETQALELAPTSFKPGFTKRLGLYKEGKPYREKPGDWK